MAVITYDGKQYQCSTAYKGEDFVHLVDADGNLIASFDGVCNFDAFSITGGTWVTPQETEKCAFAVFREDGSLTKCDSFTLYKLLHDTIWPISSGGTGAKSAGEARQNIAFIGESVLDSLAADTPVTWAEKGTGVFVCNPSYIHDMPSKETGMVTGLNIVANRLMGKFDARFIYQLICLNDGEWYTRSGYCTTLNGTAQYLWNTVPTGGTLEKITTMRDRNVRVFPTGTEWTSDTITWEGMSNYSLFYVYLSGKNTVIPVIKHPSGTLRGIGGYPFGDKTNPTKGVTTYEFDATYSGENVTMVRCCQRDHVSGGHESATTCTVIDVIGVV